ncbi:hypothetical protein SAMN06265365_1352 [Tistlia consotensis]|uniref:YaaC-like Protein n=1 Tax=Tistlia consotensis USBA 355 TaxID=560819 RepID=A0A1Y6CVA8_9PROT|nr:hypothetical protein [Tistlia consotensis]SMF79853.1 hypothetical protein SAMN05428998_14049 [Tistlia consotensis USBA 355]SNS16304.1 hypothetical protein SAMN06265365_1352 [Tistlia consotensis]
MTPPRVTKISRPKSVEYAWSGLRRFHNTRRTTDILIKRHKIPVEHFANAKKQADQIRSCLLQAKEYFDAFQISSLATKPVHLYYACMLMALAEILTKGSGNQSLDKLRDTHRHHGLLTNFDIRRTERGGLDPGLLRAKAHVSGDVKLGTFAVWQNLAKHPPLTGAVIRRFAGGGQSESVETILESDTRVDQNFPVDGLSLIDCVTHIPYLWEHMRPLGISVDLARTRIQLMAMESANEVTLRESFDIQPGNPTSIARAVEKIKIDPNLAAHTEIVEFRNGGISFRVTSHIYKKYTYENIERYRIETPHGMNLTSKDVFLLGSHDFLNEFGFLYCGLYILGMISRYYPDLWMKEIQDSTDFSIIAEYFLDAACHRLPILVLEQLSEEIILYDD